MPIRTRSIAPLRGTVSTPMAGGNDVLERLASLADRPGISPGAVKKAMLSAKSRAEQLALCKRGLRASAKHSVKAWLADKNEKLTPGLRNFLEALVGQSVLDDDGVLCFDSSDHDLTGFASANASLEVRNLSREVGAWSNQRDGMWFADADEGGRFSASVPGARAGDFVQVRSWDRAGYVTPWVTLRMAASKDSSNATVALHRLEIAKHRSGEGLSLKVRDPRRPVSEPWATLKFTNERTSESQLVTLDSKGKLPKSVALKGRCGDTFDVAVSDGVNNSDFREIAGSLGITRRGLPMPAQLSNAALHSYDLTRILKRPRAVPKIFKGPLFDKEITAADVAQGRLDNCYMPAAMASLAAADPKAIRDMIRENPDGTYTVRFHEWDQAASDFAQVYITVDTELYANKKGVFYGEGRKIKGKGMVLWYPLIEKAFATWKGSYEKIGEGGNSGSVLEACLGRWAQDVTLKKHARDIETTWTSITEALKKRAPVVLGCYGRDKDSLYRGTGIFSDHCYTVLDTKTEDKKRWVQLRNPWGCASPGRKKNDKTDKGVFWLPLEKVARYFSYLSTLDFDV
jgi:hypothetical protein